MKKNIFFSLSMVLLFLVFGSCEKEDLSKIPPNRTIIVYMAADNDLSGDASVSLDEMEQGFSETGINLIVFIDQAGANPHLLEIHQGKEKLVKSYSTLNSADPAVLKEILQNAIDLYPAQEYGLILWSHGSSWMPNGSMLKSFGNDNGTRMNIPDLARSLPVKFNFILFDACLMGSVEVAYELKEKANYIIASSTETIADGFPYDRIVPELLKPTINLQSVAKEYFNYYNEQQGAYRSATVSLIDTKQLTGLAEAMKQIVTENNINPSFDRKTVQRLDVYGEQYVFDLADFVKKAYPDSDIQSFIQQLNRSVLYKNSTPMFLSMYEIKTYCGLSCYISHPGRKDLNDYYKTLQWYKDTGMNKLF